MIVPGSANSLLLAQGAATGYNLTKSLRLRASSSAYLSKSFSSAPSTFTWSCWLKRGTLGTTQIIAGSRYVSATSAFIGFNSSDQIYVSCNGTLATTTAVYRDPAAWYHIVFKSTASGNVTIYVNGTSVATGTAPASNWLFTNTSGYVNTIGQIGDGNNLYFDGYMAEVNFIDGQALTPSSFGENNATTGVWQPKKYTGTYGTNGFYLPFTNTTSTTTLGYDFSGNSNNWTTNNISLTAGSTYDSMTDVPTLTSATAANYCVINPLQKSSNATITNGNLSYSGGAASQQSLCTIGVTSGKWYWEDTKISGTYGFAGLAQGNANLNTFAGNDAYSWGYNINGNKYYNGTATAYGATWTSGDTIGVAFDADNGTLTFYKNGTSQGTAFTGLTSGPYFASCCDFSTVGEINFGQRPFAYTPPTGFVALNTYNLPTSTIVAGNKVMDATTYTGNGGSQSISTLANFNVDLAWAKQRDSTNTASHTLVDTNRGNLNVLRTNGTDAENSANIDPTLYGGITNIGTKTLSMTTGSSGTYQGTNGSGKTYVLWAWNAGSGTTSSNTSGSITSTVSVNASAGFSVVTYTGNGTVGATVGHGLGVAPAFFLVKCRNVAADWNAYHQSAGNGYYFVLNSSASAGSSAWLNNTNPSSSVITFNNYGDTNFSGRNYVAYCWSEIAGFSKFGSYTGNGSADGSFVYTGFRPKFVMIKRTDAVNQWGIWDSVRGSYNLNQPLLEANASDAEYNSSSYALDFLSNGFKLRATDGILNASGGNYIFMAFAENPTKFALAR